MSLDSLGLSEEQERVYRALVEMAAATLEELGPRSAVAIHDLEGILGELQNLGLVTRATTDEARFVPSPPDVALAALLVERHEELRRAQLQVAELSALYAGGGGRRGVIDVIDVVRGADSISQRFAQLQRGATSSVLGLIKTSVVVPRLHPDIERMALERGVKFSIVLERAFFDRPGFLDSTEEALRDGMALRIAQQVPLRALIVDRSLAMIPLQANETQAPFTDALLIHPSGLLDTLLTAFDLIWERASALALVSGRPAEVTEEGLDALDTRVLSLLFAGLTDQAIANQLGMSLRTVQRRVRSMMDTVGVDTRLQLGYEAGKRNWL